LIINQKNKTKKEERKKIERKRKKERKKKKGKKKKGRKKKKLESFFSHNIMAAFSAEEEEWKKPRCVIIGGGLVGTTLGIGLAKCLGDSVTIEIHEQAPVFEDDVGGAIGIYPNGFAVLRDFDQELISDIRKEGIAYERRRWMKHDGTITAEASESNLCEWQSPTDEAERTSLGIRRWRLQKVLTSYAEKKYGIKLYFNHQLVKVTGIGAAGSMTCWFQNGDQVEADLLFGCDGVKSPVRASLFGRGTETEPAYTGITLIMGAADVEREPGICFPASPQNGLHATYYPTGVKEQIFQVYYPIEERPETWKALTAEEGAKECQELADRMEAAGWHQQFLKPLRQAKSVIRVGLRARQPLERAFRSRCVLLGDSWHPPVPYLGQGFMSGVEDVGVLVHLLEKMCLINGRFVFDHLDLVFSLYEKIRLPRTTSLFLASTNLGEKQRLRSRESASKPELAADEWSLWFQIKLHGTLPSLKEGSSYDYKNEVDYWVSRWNQFPRSHL
jgi:salicylate hydroxylase